MAGAVLLRLTALALLLSALPLASAGGPAPAPTLGGPVLLTEVLYNAALGDEFVTLANAASTPVDLTGWYLSDGEGTVSLPALLLPPDGSITLTENSTAYYLETLESADYTWRRGTAPAVNTSGQFQLANGNTTTGDALLLCDASGTIRDVFAWWNVTYSGPGWNDPTLLKASRGEVMTRAWNGTWADTDTSADWRRIAPRFIGQSDFPLTPYNVSGTVEAFVSPGRSQEVLPRYLGSASLSVRVAVYQFTSLLLQDALLAARARGVSVRVLLEGGPVGGIDQREWGIAGNLSVAGIDVRFLDDGGRPNYSPRYANLHAKYAVIDDATAVVSSENWGDSGIPPFGTRGNRGWHVAVADAAVATHFAAVFDADFNPARLDSIPYADMAVSPVEYAAEPAGRYDYTVEPFLATGPHRVTPVIGPENSFDAILGLLRSARQRLYIEQFYAYKEWDSGPNRFLEEAVEAARRGVEVKILLDATWYNVNATDPNDNDDTVANLTAVAAAEGLPLEARLADDAAAHQIVKYHNKGVVVDGARVLVSSFNWNEFSPTRNREVGVIVESAGVAGYFERLFLHDWTTPVPPLPDVAIVAATTVNINETMAFSGTDLSPLPTAVVNWSWDLDGDGGFDAFGRIVDHRYAVTGDYTVRVVGRDAWGYEAVDTHRVQVHEPTVKRPPATEPPAIPWAIVVLAAAGFALLLFLSLFYRWRKR